jgi:dihydroorotate dehydrogenase (NAD+) catalytic subunit
VRALALDQVRRVAAEASIPVIGMGGIESGADALAFLALGASAVAVGTASFRDPAAASRIRDELAAQLAGRGLDRLPRAGLAFTSS